MNSNLLIQFQNPASAALGGTENSLKLEQKPWDDYVGKITSSDLLTLMDGLLYNGSAMTGMEMYRNPFQFIDTMIARMRMISQMLALNCGINPDGSISVVIYAYASPSSLSYSLSASQGTLLRMSRDFIDQSEVIPVNYVQSVELDYPVQAIEYIDWQGDTWDAYGNITAKPGITVKAGVLYFTKKVYGIVNIKYTTVRDAYKLTVPARDDTKKDVYGSVVYGVYNGGVEYLEVTPPPNADEMSNSGSICGWDWEVIIEMKDEEKICRLPAVEGDKTINIEYCSQKREE